MILIPFHAIEERMRSKPEHCILYFCKINSKVEKLLKLAETQRMEVRQVSFNELDELVGENRGFALEIKEKYENEVEGDLKTHLSQIKNENALILLLDGITDPHNYGAILRSADQFKVDLVILTTRRSASDTQTVASTSAGALQYVPHLRVNNLALAIKDLKKAGFWIYGAQMNGKESWKCELKGKVALILGSEGKGLSMGVEGHCDHLISIPSRGHVDSFNVSVAAGILMYEIKRQQWN